MKDVLVIGGGFAGVWSAAGAVRATREAGEEVRVTLISGGDDLVVRPRLYEEDPESKRVPLDRVLGPIGVRRVTATVTGIDTGARTVRAVGRAGEDLTLSYDKLVLAAGSRLVRPDFPGARNVFDVDTLSAAAAFDHHLRRLPQRAPSPGRYTAVVVGAGFTGLEVATGLGERLRAIADAHGAGEEVRVVLVDRADVLGPELGPGPRPQIDGAVDELKIERRLGRTVASATCEDVTLSDGEVIPTATVVWTAGMVASSLTAQIPGERDRLGRLSVDAYLRVTGVPDVYAAGDTASALAEEGHYTTQSCQHAQPMGKFAGHNVAADLLGTDPLPFTPDPYGVCLDLGPAGAVVTQGWDRTVQMTGEGAKALKRDINTLWIYPPVDDPEQILAQAGRFSNL
ncbi:FAD-dependent oxidoreductase [Streptomyces sp. NBC_01799]|uniref:NAD(P)/FAD-dependent oxidoreductase n=1 Tax=Streptomyces sp. NBC_01800 TaxID=2975945 RepID=UPI002DD9AB02|nr:FAD-dependent oxidoreductase [Streptomyces sp. NBC_01800]WSA66127.1 FAD-dependent oxidoreductase [Streptomyces sp. NBC_01800]WSA74728.1 FAD-dependent oxidoreductase [Streptomyces sp. NBC_01799]